MIGKRRKKKPDLMVILAVVVGFGVIASSLAQGMLNSSDTETAQLANATSTNQTHVVGSSRLRP